MGEPHAQVQAIYAEAGFAPRLASDPADHIGLELAFVALLATRIATARSFKRKGARDGRLMQRFVQEHVQTWMPQFAEKLEAAAIVPLYRAAGSLLAALAGRTASVTAAERAS